MSEPFKTDKPSDPSGKPWIEVGTKVRAQWFKAQEIGTWSLAGAMPKLTGSMLNVVGTIRHIMGDHPTAPTSVHVFLDAEGEVSPEITRRRPIGCTCENGDLHVEIDANFIKAIIPPSPTALEPAPEVPEKVPEPPKFKFSL